MRIIIETIPHKDQRYPTTGDWFFKKNGEMFVQDEHHDGTTHVVQTGEDLHVRVSRMGDWRYEALVGIHEAIEAVLCRHAGISEEAVTAFDVEFEAARQHFTVRTPPGQETEFKFRGDWVPMSREPGDYPAAPYRHQHFYATLVERMLAGLLDVDWQKYEEAMTALG